MPLDIQLFRKEGGNPDAIRESQRRRYQPVEIVDEIIAKDDVWRRMTGSIDDMRKKRNVVQKDIATLKKANAKESDAAVKAENDAKCEVLLTEKNRFDKEIEDTEKEQITLKVEIEKLINKIGNIVCDTVPVSQDEDADNRVERKWGVPRDPKGLLNHHDLLWRIGGYEPERGANVAGHRGYFLRDVGVLLNQAFINYGIAFLRKKGYTVLQPPYMMKKDVMAGVAQLEQFDEELYKVSGDTDDKYLIATSEQPICAYHKDEWMDEKGLPLLYAGISTCFRKEAGSHGRDTWGIFRVHQFEKVEQFAIVEGDLAKSQAMQEEMIAAAEEFYQSLGFPYHVINIVSGALNNAAIRKYDLECWFPGYNNYRELVSCSNCTDYQSRAMEIRCGIKKLGDREKKYVHMLNATLCATGRAICCLLENYQEADGVRIPEVLVPFMGGITFLPFVRDSKAPDRNAATATINPPKKQPTAAPAAAEPVPTAAPVAVTSEVVPPAAPAASTEKPKKEEKEKKPKEKKEKVAAPAAPPAPVYVTTPDVIKSPPSYVTSAPKISSQDYSATPVADTTAEESADEAIPTAEDVLGSATVLATAEARLFYYSFIGGDLPTQADVRVWETVKETVTGNEYPNVARWLRYMNATTPAVRGTWA